MKHYNIQTRSDIICKFPDLVDPWKKCGRMTIFLGIRSRSVPIFKVDSVVFDRLSREFVHERGINRTCDIRIELEGCGKGRRIGSVLAQTLARECSQLRRCFRCKQVRAAIAGVNRLSSCARAGVKDPIREVRARETFVERMKGIR